MANFTSTHTGAVIDAAVTKITATSSSATELNLLDGVTSTTAEINILDGVTSTAAEINILDGVTATTAEINLLDGVTATTTELNLIDGVTATTAEINYIDGVTSNIQTQLNLKAPLAGASLTGTTSFQNLSDGTITITAFADEDDFSSNSATLLATQQSIKAYVDANVNTELIQDLVGAMFTSNTESGITVAYQDGDGTIDLTVATQSDNNFTTTLKNKLDAIEESATADQTASEIRTLVESASDSNVFTDDDHSKLNAIEASADVTDTANVTSAGAVMDSELTSIADVKALNQSVVSGATPTFTTTNFTDASNKRLMTDAQETKLDSVESSADVTDTANVTSSGALMDSELTDLAGVKGVTISTLQPKPSEGAFANGDKTKLDAIESGATADQTDEEIQDVVGAMFSSNTETGITATYQDGDGTIDLVVGTLNQDTTGNADTATKIASITNSDIVQLTSSQTLTNKTLTSPVLNTGVSGSAILDEDNMASNSATKLSSQQSIKAYVDAEVAGVVDSSPAALNTLNELAAALGDDANFSTTTSTSLGNRLRVDTASQGLTGTQQANAITNLGITATKAELNILDGVTATAAELNIMDGVTATTAELNYTDGVTSNIQTQLDATLDTAGTGIDISSTTVSVDVSDFMANGSNNRILTATGTDAMNAEANFTFNGTHASLAATSALYFDGGSDTYIQESSDDFMKIFVGGQQMLGLFEGSTDSVFAPDNVRLGVGNSPDLVMYHDASNSHILNSTGDLIIKNSASDEDISIQVSDDGVTTTALQIDASETGRVLLPNDNQQLRLGAGQDLQLWHDGSNSYISQTATGDLYIRNMVNDKDIILQSDDGSGGTTAYLTLDGSQTRTNVSKDLRLDNSVNLQLGGGGNMSMSHDGSNATFSNATGNLTIQTSTDDGDVILQSDDGSGGVTPYITLDGSATRVKVDENFEFQDSVVLKLGTDDDFRMYHDGSNTYFRQEGTGKLDIRSDVADGDIVFRADDGTGSATTAYLTLDGSASLNILHQNTRINDSKYFYLGTDSDFSLLHNNTNAYIENTTGDLYIRNYADDKDIVFSTDDGSGGVTPYLTLDGSISKTTLSKDLRAVDNVKITAGNADDLQIYHDGTNSNIVNTTGDFYLYNHGTADKDFIFVVNDGGSNVTALQIDGSEIGRVKLPNDGQRLVLGASDDLHLEHSGTHSYISNQTGDFIIQTQGTDSDMIFRSDDGSGGLAAYLTLDGGATDIKIAQKMQFPASHSADKITMYSGGNEKIGTEANTLLFTADNFKFKDTAGHENLTIDSSGNLTFPVAGKLYFDGGNDTYIDEVAANSLGFTTGGGERMRLNTTGLGIGKTPSYKLDVNTTDAGVLAQFQLASDTDGRLQIYVDANASSIGNDSGLAGETIYFQDDLGIRFYTHGSETMRLTTGGTLGIGTAGGTHKLHIDSNGSSESVIRIDGDDARGGSRYALDIVDDDTNNRGSVRVRHNSGSGNPPLYIAEGYDHSYIFQSKNTSASDAEQFRIEHYDGNVRMNSLRGTLAINEESGNNVGIGTSSPAGKLHTQESGTGNGLGGIISETTTHNGNAGYRFRTDGTDRWSIRTVGTNGADLSFRDADASAERMYIDSSGNVGIGETSVDAKLHLTTASSGLINQKFESSGSSAWRIGIPAGQTYFAFDDSSDDLSSPEVVFTTAGNVGIGETSPEAKLHIKNASAGTFTASNSQLLIENNTTVRLSMVTPTNNASKIEFGDVDDQDAGILEYNNSDNSMRFTTNASERMRIDNQGNLRFADNGTNPSAAANTAFMFNDGGELKVLDELGNTTTISPHNFELIPDGASEDMAFAYHSTRHTPEGKLKKVNVDMMKLARLVEELTGEKLVYIDEQ